MGVTYKEDCNDLRNSKIIDLVKVLKKQSLKLPMIFYFITKYLKMKQSNFD